MSTIALLRPASHLYPVSTGSSGGDCAMTPSDDAVAAHLRHLELSGYSPGTIYARKRALARLAAWLWPVSLLSATPRHLAAWREGLDLTPDAIVHYVGHARQFYEFCVATGRRRTSPATGLPVPKTGRRIPRPISEDDLMAALDAAPRRIRIWLVLAAWCGLRACEIAQMRVQNILLTAMPPVIIVAEDATKGVRGRVVPLSSFAVSELAACGLPSSGWAFRRRDGQRGPNTPARISHLANNHLHACGIAATLHQLRHRFGTQAYHVRRDLRVVQELMGHADPETTAIYVAFDKPDAAAAVEGLPVPRRLRAVRNRKEAQ